MEFHFVRTLGRRTREVVALTLVCLPLLSAAQVTAKAAAPSMAGPSLVQASKGAVFEGRGYKPNTSVSIALVAPNGVETQLTVMVNAEGNVSYRLPGGAAGQYKLSVLDSSGKALASTNFMVVQ